MGELLKKRKIIVVAIVLLLIVFVSMEFVNSQNLNLSINAYLNEYSSDSNLKTRGDAMFGFDSYDFISPDVPANGTGFYSMITGYNLTIDTWNYVDKLLNLTFELDVQQNGTVNFSWVSLDSNEFICDFLYFSNDSTYTILNTTVSMTSNTNYSNLINNTKRVFAQVNVSSVAPTINFTSPTPGNNTFRTVDNIFVNVTTNDSGNTSLFIDFDDSLVFWMRMDDLNSSGHVIDASSKGYTVTYSGSPVINDSGKFGKAVSFGGYMSGDHIEVFNLSFDPREVTYSMWIKSNDVSSDWEGLFTNSIDSSGSGNADLMQFIIHTTDGGLYASNDYGIRISNCNIDKEKWIHVVVVVSNSTKSARMYLNGTKCNEDLIFDINVTSSGNYTFIGARANLWNWNGSIDDVMIFNRTLSDSEIISLYANTSQQFLEVNFTNLSDANHTFKVYSQDEYGVYNFTDEHFVILDATSPSITNVTYENQSGILNGTVSRYDNLTINATVSDADYVWAKIWEGAIGISTVIWEGFLNLISGNMWSITITTNQSFPNGTLNYTVFANNTVGTEVNFTSNITIVENVSVSSCRVLDTANTVYTLVGNITDDSLSSPCINITAINVTFDCQ
ncbi:LamG domain-containing protein, partial [Candidatus Pacearchaeota archaeon]|nr:LamG domain-containing protein [Candidatus Pacearchaeota archaeon]